MDENLILTFVEESFKEQSKNIKNKLKALWFLCVILFILVGILFWKMIQHNLI